MSEDRNRRPWRVPQTRGWDARIRFARLTAARAAGRGCARQAILSGSWDRGHLVQQHMGEADV